MKLIFFGTDTFSAPSLEALLSHNFDVVAVVTKPDSRVGRGRTLTAPPVKQIAEQHDIPVLQPTRLADIVSDLAAFEPDAGVVVAYGRILPQSVLDVFPQGLINVHASLLPRYRGSAPIEAAILNGDATAGVSLMKIELAMDAGGVYTQEDITLTGHESKPQLYETLSQLGAKLLVRDLAAILDGKLMPEPQDETQVVSVKMITKQDGALDWAKPAEELERQIRAYLGWPGSRTRLCDADVTVTQAHVGDSTPMIASDATGSRPGTPFKTAAGELAVTTGQGELIIDRLTPAGKREMTGADFLAGHRL